MKKWVIGLLVVLGLVLIVAVGAATFGYYRFYKPLLSANTYVGGAQRLESIIANTSPYVPPATGELTADQVARFVIVEERVEARVGAQMAVLRTQREVLSQAAGGPTSRVVRGAMGEIGGRYLQAKETQYRALNEVGFSKAEYDWVRRRVYAAAGLPVTHIDLPQILVDPGNLEDVVAIDRWPDSSAAAGHDKPLVEPHVARLQGWLVLAFFDL